MLLSYYHSLSLSAIDNPRDGHAGRIMMMYESYSDYRGISAGGECVSGPAMLKRLRLLIETDHQQRKKLKICGPDVTDIPPEVFELLELEVCYTSTLYENQ